ncbi:acyl-CoA thioester hydrolase/BAAT C-terminal domain-containing protein [Streptomyces griseofuscus]|uniref:acyl-CoA thioester hydrolase/BAAT C-terminal domain-containing protein n=1 Tax=Streptomyces griseofuscus TaxID=146922 RepID=UPI001FAC3197|nr:acyl-CoA thioester hydrolase/BAAT C-terminal domain-containing protein [Streptomyces griseofuscus]
MKGPTAAGTLGGLVEIVERELAEPWEGLLASPVGGSAVGVLVLAGSSGRVMRERARLLARQGITALTIRWFGGPGQPPGICEVPLETFTAAVDLLRGTGARRIGVLGVSKGAEAALLTAVRDDRVDVVAALSPSPLVWCNVGPGRDGADRPYRSCWTWRGRPLPFVPMDDSWTPAEPEGGPVAIRGWYERSERTFAALLPAAEIPVEAARAELILVAGGDDAMWPSEPYAERLAERRRAAGAPVRLITRADAGHRPLFPGELPPPPSPTFRYGGTPEADGLLGAAAWPHLLDALLG